MGAKIFRQGVAARAKGRPENRPIGPLKSQPEAARRPLARFRRLGGTLVCLFICRAAGAISDALVAGCSWPDGLAVQTLLSVTDKSVPRAPALQNKADLAAAGREKRKATEGRLGKEKLLG
jgi:hypothetical protein